MRTLIPLCLAVAMPFAAAATETREQPIGDLAITYDLARWRFESDGDATIARCIDCRGDGSIAMTVADMTREESESVLDPAWARNRTHSALTVGDLTIPITAIHSPCRNYVPSAMSARLAYKGRTYAFRSGVAVGCHNSDGVGGQKFEELLRGLHPN